MLIRLKGQLLTGGILMAILLACFFPNIGSTGGPLKTEITTKIAIALIFFFQGLTLNTRKLLISVTRWRLHIYCQSCIFLISPALMLLLMPRLGSIRVAGGRQRARWPRAWAQGPVRGRERAPVRPARAVHRPPWRDREGSGS